MELTRAAAQAGGLLVDKSAWVRGSGEMWESALEADRLWICDVTRLEILYGARDGGDVGRLNLACDAFHQAKVNAETFSVATAGIRDLGVNGRHRVPLPDLLIGACAHQHGLDVLHVDRHFETIAGVLNFRPVRLL